MRDRLRRPTALYPTELRHPGALDLGAWFAGGRSKDATLVAELHERAGHWPLSQLQSARAASGRRQRTRSDQEHTARVPAGREMANCRWPWSRPARRLGGRGSHRRRSHLLLGGGAVPLHGLRFHDLRGRRSRSRGHRGTGNAAPAAIRRAPGADGTMTLRCIVGRILQEPIEPAERDAAAELADALHDALDSTTPASSNGR